MVRVNSLKAQQGLSIIELMIALTLGLIITLGLTQIFTSNSRSFAMTEGVSRTQETGRMAGDFLDRSLRNADYWGCVSRSSVANHLDSTSSGFNDYLHGFDHGFSADQADGSGTAITGTDFFTVRGGNGNGDIRVSDAMPTSSADIKVNSVSGISVGEVLIISDCVAGDIFQVTGIASGATPHITHNTGNSTSPGNTANPTGGVVVVSDNTCPGGASNCLSKQYDKRAEISRPYTRTFEIREIDGEHALYMVEDGSAVELVRGVWDMQLRVGMDAGLSNGRVTTWQNVTAGSLTDTESDDVVAVQISLLVRSPENNLVDTPMSVCYPSWSDCSAGPNYAVSTHVGADSKQLYRVYNITSTIRNRMIQVERSTASGG